MVLREFPRHRYVGSDRIDIGVEQDHAVGLPSLLYLKGINDADGITVSVGNGVNAERPSGACRHSGNRVSADGSGSSRLIGAMQGHHGVIPAKAGIQSCSRGCRSLPRT